MNFQASHIALDYDNCYSRDPAAWDTFILTMKERGHNVFIVTYRDQNHDRNAHLDRLQDMGVEVYWTAGVAKQWFMEQFGCPVDIWIDDRPASIFENSKFPKDQLVLWRQDNAKAAADLEAEVSTYPVHGANA